MDNFDLQRAIGFGTNIGSVDIGNFSNFVRSQALGALEYLVGDCLGSWGTVGEVVLDPKVVIGAYNIN